MKTAQLDSLKVTEELATSTERAVKKMKSRDAVPVIERTKPSPQKYLLVMATDISASVDGLAASESLAGSALNTIKNSGRTAAVVLWYRSWVNLRGSKLSLSLL